MYKVYFLVALSIITWLAGSMPQSFADGFLDFPIRLEHSPTICAVEPESDNTYPELGNQMLRETEYAVLDWNQKLNQGMTKHPLWNITLVQVPLWEEKNFDYSNCDITINFLKKPDQANLEYVVAGMTVPNFEEGKSRIEIYYLGINIVGKEIRWNQGGSTYYKYVDVPEYTGFIANEPQLAGTIRHEIGHALGLRHYMVSPYELQKIVHGKMDMPSIMIDMVTVIGVTHYDITPIDIAEVKSIYGSNGFDHSSQNNPYLSENMISTDKIDYKPMQPILIHVNENRFDANWTGTLFILDSNNRPLGLYKITSLNNELLLENQTKAGNYYLEFIDNQKEIYDYSGFTISNDISSTGDWLKNNAKLWSEGLATDNDFIKGIQYMVNNGIMQIPPNQEESKTPNQGIPSWVKNNAGWWAKGEISDDEFVKGIQYLVSSGIIKI